MVQEQKTLGIFSNIECLALIVCFLPGLFVSDGDLAVFDGDLDVGVAVD